MWYIRYDAWFMRYDIWYMRYDTWDNIWCMLEWCMRYEIYEIWDMTSPLWFSFVDFTPVILQGGLERNLFGSRAGVIYYIYIYICMSYVKHRILHNVYIDIEREVSYQIADVLEVLLSITHGTFFVCVCVCGRGSWIDRPWSLYFQV